MYKSKLQELCRKKIWELPRYSTTKHGLDHSPTFQASVTVNGYHFHSQSFFRTSKLAQNEAAKLAFDYMSVSPLRAPTTSQLLSQPQPTPQSPQPQQQPLPPPHTSHPQPQSPSVPPPQSSQPQPQLTPESPQPQLESQPLPPGQSSQPQSLSVEAPQSSPPQSESRSLLQSSQPQALPLPLPAELILSSLPQPSMPSSSAMDFQHTRKRLSTSCDQQEDPTGKRTALEHESYPSNICDSKLENGKDSVNVSLVSSFLDEPSLLAAFSNWRNLASDWKTKIHPHIDGSEMTESPLISAVQFIHAGIMALYTREMTQAKKIKEAEAELDKFRAELEEAKARAYQAESDAVLAKKRMEEAELKAVKADSKCAILESKVLEQSHTIELLKYDKALLQGKAKAIMVHGTLTEEKMRDIYAGGYMSCRRRMKKDFLAGKAEVWSPSESDVDNEIDEVAETLRMENGTTEIEKRSDESEELKETNVEDGSSKVSD